MKVKKIDIKIRAKITPLKEKVIDHIKSKYFKDTATQLLLIPSFALLIAVWILALYYFQASEYLVPLKYNSFLGVLNIGSWYELYQLPIFLTLCFGVNLTLGKIIYEKDKFVGYILAASNIFLALIVLVLVINFGKLIG